MWNIEKKGTETKDAKDFAKLTDVGRWTCGADQVVVEVRSPLVFVPNLAKTESGKLTRFRHDANDPVKFTEGKNDAVSTTISTFRLTNSYKVFPGEVAKLR